MARRLAAGLASAERATAVRVPRRMARPDEPGFDRLAEALTEEWPLAGAHVFVAAAGAIVRCLAPLVVHKSADPAVVVCDQNGRFAVSLLSGHLGGANDLAREAAACLGAQAVITTATDCADLPAFDLLAERAGCAFADVGEVKAVSAALLEGGTVNVLDTLGVLDATEITACPQCRMIAQPRETDADSPDVEVVTSLAPLEPRPGRLRLHPRLTHVGVGCRKGVPVEVIERAVRLALDEADVSPLTVAGMASAAIKEDEPGLREAAEVFGVKLRCFSAGELAAVTVPHPSLRAAEALGVEQVGVCEASALLSAGPRAVLVLPKRTYSGAVTVALARASRAATK